MKKVMAIASGGGHWVQLLRLRPAFSHHDVTFVSTNSDYAKDVNAKFHCVLDANMWDKWALFKMFMQVLWLVIKARPDVVITTGAAPGFAAVFFGRVIGARTIWVDSIANSEQLSQSGSHAGKFVNVWLTQWEHLSDEKNGLNFWGSVL